MATHRHCRDTTRDLVTHVDKLLEVMLMTDRLVKNRLNTMQRQLDRIEMKQLHGTIRDTIRIQYYPDGRAKHLDCVGMTDITTDTAHIEVKHWDNWKKALGHLIVYNREDPKEELCAYLFGEYDDTAKVQATHVMNSMGIKVFDCDPNPEDNSCEVTLLDVSLTPSSHPHPRA